MSERLTEQEYAAAMEWAQRNAEHPNRLSLGRIIARALLQAHQDARRYGYARARKDSKHGACWLSYCKSDDPNVPPQSIVITEGHADAAIDRAIEEGQAP